MGKKFYFQCRECGTKIEGFKEWFAANQACPSCKKSNVYTIYSTEKEKIKPLIANDAKPESLWHYFDFLPLENKENILTEGEGAVPIERWPFLENFAKRRYNLSLKVYVGRNDKSFATGTFKDKGGTLAASVMKEHGIKEYVVVSTGNTATAFAHYMSRAGVSLSVFLPENALNDSVAHIGTYGQKVFSVKGDYAYAKKVAADYATKHGILITGGNLDPLRLEAKKTQVFEILREIGYIPDVYIQALSGGTGPFAVEKGINDLEGTGLADKLPRFLLAQGDRCAPQAMAWAKAKSEGFPEGYQFNYPVIDNPEPLIPTIATGNPKTYPLMAPLVRKSGGEIYQIKEELAIDVARLIGFERVIKIGPASAAAILGYFESLKQGFIKDGETVFINMGESANRAFQFMHDAAYTTSVVSTVEDCERFDRKKYRDLVWKPFEID
ncbi:MAG: pyridoxal-phosphate dependent enzyme [Bacteroidales bacterium]